MSRTRKGRRTCPSCAPGCKCDWCMGGVNRRFERQAPAVEAHGGAARNCDYPLTARDRKYDRIEAEYERCREEDELYEMALAE